MTKRQQIIAAVLLVLPTLVLSGLVAKNEIDKNAARTWRVKITGYDPRDLLYGHYLNFRFDWGGSLGACPSSGDCCLCFEGNEGPMTPAVSYKTCEQASACASRINVSGLECERFGRCANRGLDPEMPQQYFIPEESAPRLDTLLRRREHKMSVDLKITPSGRHMLDQLYIDDVPWKEFLKQNPEAGKVESRREMPQSVAPVTPAPSVAPPAPSEPPPEDSGQSTAKPE